MQKVTLKYEINDEYTNPRNYTVEFDLASMNFDEFLEEIKRFALVIGYHPDTVNRVFSEY